MNRLSAFIVLALLFVAVPSSIYSEEKTVSFVITQPPVGYPVFVRGEKTLQTGGDLLYLNMDVMDEKMMILGGTAFGNYQSCPSDVVAIQGSFGGSLLIGNKYDMIIGRLPLQISGIVQPVRTNRLSIFLFAAAGGDIGLTDMTLTVPQWVMGTSTFIDDDTSVITTSVNGLINGGAQINILAGDFIISPFGSWTYTGGTYSTTQTSTMSYEYPSTSGSIENYSSLVFGFDILYVPMSIALSSQLRTTDNYTMVSVALKWLLKGK